MRRANVWKKAACVALSLLYFLQIKPQVVQAADYWPEGPEGQSPSVILMEMSTGTVLYEKNSDERNYPASITKIMTTLLALENSDLNEVVTFSDDAINNTEGSGIYRDYGEQMTMEQCLYAVMLNSANECAYAVAEHVGGTVEHFVDMMNEKAAELGLTCSPEVTCQLQDGVPFPVEVTMDIPKNAALSRIIAADLGIDEAHQRWRETE